MRLLAACILVFCLLLASATPSHARGTPAGTDIVSQASVTWAMEGNNRSGTSNETTLTVDEVMDFSVVWQDAVEVAAFPGDEQLPLTFRLENTGNGFETFRLTGLDALAGDDFDPTLTAIHLDTNGSGEYDPGLDEVYAFGSNDPLLAADEAVVVFLVSDIPAGQIDGERGQCKLVVTASGGTGPPGTIVYGGGDGGTDAIIGNQGGVDEQTGNYVVAAVTVTLAKAATVVDPLGGTDPCSGALVTYAISVSVTGAGTARGVTVTDPLPSNTVYSPQSIQLNGVSLTDAADGDVGDYGATQADIITVALGDFDAAMPTQEITFQVIIE